MNIGRILRTIRHLRAQQVVWQVRNRLMRPQFTAEVEAPNVSLRNWVEPCAKPVSVVNERLAFLNITDDFCGWNDKRHGMLWAYNLNYMDWLGQPNLPENEGRKWIDRFIASIPSNSIGLDPYPIALRSINWIKFFCRYPHQATVSRLNSLYAQVLHLEKRLEFHLLGNHLLEDAFALYIAANFFKDNRLLKKSSKLLIKELREQVLPDGAHYEQSPMYHCILLDRLLDCINYGRTDEYKLREFASKMLGHLEVLCWYDGSIPLLNDAANSIAPSSGEIFDYARRLGITWQPLHMNECGYRKMRNDRMEAIIDVGNIKASYQPGHSHADTFNFELRMRGLPFIVDTGTSTYEKNGRRQYERSTAAHNTVCLEGKDSSEVWGGFRVGKRATTHIISESAIEVTALHKGFLPTTIHKRSFTISNQGFEVKDDLNKNIRGINQIHFAPDVEIISYNNKQIITNLGKISISGATNINIKNNTVSRYFNQLEHCIVAEIHFCETMNYSIYL